MRKYLPVILVLSTFLHPVTAQGPWHKIVYPGSGWFEGIQPVTNGAIIRPTEGKGGLFLTQDSGLTWKPLSDPFDVLNEPPFSSGVRTIRYGSKDSIIVVDGTDMVGQVHCFLSKNLGITWKEIKPAPDGITTAALVVHKGRVLTSGYMAYIYREQLNRWDTVIHRPVRLYAQEQVIWAHSDTGAQDSLYKSTDGGQTWTATRPLSANRIIIRGDTIVTTYPFRRSFNGGVTWQDYTFGPIYDLYDDGESLYIVTANETYRTTDFFDTVHKLFAQPIHNVIRLDNQHILTSGNLGCYRSADNGMQWERSNTGMGPNNHGYGLDKAGQYLIANYTIFGDTHNELVQAFSADNGRTWKGCVEHPFLYRIIQAGNHYFGVYGSNLYRSKNDIAQWEPVVFPGTDAFADLRLASRHDTLLIYGTKTDPYQCRIWWADTKLDSLIFHLVSTPLPFSPKGHVMHGNTLYITDDFNIKKSTNQGQSWQTVSAPPFGGGLYSDGPRLYFIGYQAIAYTLNGGNLWQLIPFPSDMIGQLQAVSVGDTSIYILDSGENIFYQNQGSTVWDILAGFPFGLGKGNVLPFGGYRFIPDSFGDIWTNDPGYVGTHTAEEAHQLIVFPNPVEDKVEIHFPADAPTGSILRIFSQNGSLVLERSNPGHSLVLTASQWPAGMYYFIWNSGNHIYSSKVVKSGNRH